MKLSACLGGIPTLQTLLYFHGQNGCLHKTALRRLTQFTSESNPYASACDSGPGTSRCYQQCSSSTAAC